MHLNRAVQGFISVAYNMVVFPLQRYKMIGLEYCILTGRRWPQAVQAITDRHYAYISPYSLLPHRVRRPPVAFEATLWDTLPNKNTDMRLDIAYIHTHRMLKVYIGTKCIRRETLTFDPNRNWMNDTRASHILSSHRYFVGKWILFVWWSPSTSHQLQFRLFNVWAEGVFHF